MSNYWPISRVFTDEGFSPTYTPCLAYHSIIADDARIAHSRYDVIECQFESQMRFLYDQGYSCLKLADLFRLPKIEEPKRKKSFVLTFDDGFEDFYSRACPILRKYGFTAANFLVTDLIGEKGDYNNEMAIQRMSWEQINGLSAEGFSFGSHTCSHARLPDLKREQIWHELIDSKKSLEAQLGQELLTLAYPYGASSPAIREMAMQTGYHAAFGVNTGEPGPFNLWRTEIGARDSMRTFISRLTGAYSYYMKLRGWVRESTAIGRFLRSLKIHYRGALNADGS